MLGQEGNPYPVLKITTKGFNVLYGKEDAKALKRGEPEKRKAGTGWPRTIR